MKKKILAVLICLLCVEIAHAGTYDSQFGFSIDLPAHWKIINEKSFKNHPEQYSNKRYQSLSDTYKKEILEGKAEIYEHLSADSGKFRDTIFVQVDHGDLKPIKSLESAICNIDMLQEAYAKQFGRPIKVHACKVIRVQSYDAVYTDFDGATPGTRSLQYQIWKPSNDIIVMTLTARNETIGKLRDEFTGIIYSFKATR
jgi:hypothetical protein